MTAPKKTEKLSPPPKHLSLLDIAAFVDEDIRQVQRIAKIADIPNAEKGQYDFRAYVRAVKEYYKGQANRVSEAKSADQARQAKADADRSEIALAKDQKLLCFRSDVLAVYEDGNVAMRRAIKESKKIPESLKATVIEILQSAKLDEERISELPTAE